MLLLNKVKYLWLYCKNRKLLIKDKYFNDIYNAEVGLLVIKPAFSDKSSWQYLTVYEAYFYLQGIIASLNSIVMKNM